MIHQLIGAAALLCVLASSLTAQEVSPAERLRSAGVEPTLEGIRDYLQRQVGVEAQQSVAKLIAQLGHDEFSIRERASREIADLAPLPIAALTTASKSDDPEMAWRAQRLLKQVRPQNDKTLSAAVELVAAQQLAVGIPLLLQVYQHVESPEAKAEVLAALLGTVREADRPAVEGLLKQADKTQQDLGRVLLARLDKKELPLDLARSFDAVKVKPGGVAGGGSNLIAGWEFKAKADLTVTHLGIFDRQPTGLGSAHEVAIWDLEEREKPLVIDTIPAGEKAVLAGEFRLVQVTRAKLKADRRYAIVAHYADPADSAVSKINPSGLTIEFSPHLEVLGRRYAFPHKAMAFPNNAQAGIDHATIGPTFRYETLEVGK